MRGTTRPTGGPPDDAGALVGAHPAGLDRHALLTEVRRGLAHLPEAAPVVVACSAGPDSTALAFLVDEAREDLDVTLVHVRHGLRSPEDDDREAAAVERHGAWLGRPVLVRQVEVVPAGQGREAAARDARYAALRAVAAETGAVAVLTAHHADDLAETVLLRVARGTGIGGLGAMIGVDRDLVRPLLRVRREDLRAFVVQEGLAAEQDPMNADPDLGRVRVRTEVLPALERVAPDPVGALVRLAELARADDDLLAASARAASARDVPVHRVGDVVLLPSGPLGATHVALARRIVHVALAALPGGPADAATVGRVLAAVDGTRATLPGRVDLAVGRGWHVLAPPELPLPDPIAVPLEGRVVWPPAGVALDAGRVDRGGAAALQLPLPLDAVTRLPPTVRRERLLVRLAGVTGLVLRARRPGDRLRTAAGTRRLGDVLAEAGLPPALRARWPVVADATDPTRVVWVPGIAVDVDAWEAGRAAPSTQLSVGPVPFRGP